MRPLNLGPEAPPPEPAALGELLGRARALKVAWLAGELDPAEGAAQLEDATRGLAALRVEALAKGPVARAFWLNLYNLLVIHGLFACRVRGSILKRWGFFRRVAYIVGGRRFSADDIEHGILRGNRGHPLRLWMPQFGPWDGRRREALELDPRIHFILNCAAASCPPLRCVTAEGLDDELELATRAYLGQEVSVDRSARRVTLSPLVVWYAGDFGAGWPERLRWIASYLPDPEDAAALADGGPWRRRLGGYDWSLA